MSFEPLEGLVVHQHCVMLQFHVQSHVRWTQLLVFAVSCHLSGCCPGQSADVAGWTPVDGSQGPALLHHLLHCSKLKTHPVHLHAPLKRNRW